MGNTWLCALLATGMTAMSFVSGSSYFSVPGHDSPGGQLFQVQGATLQDLKTICDSLRGKCVGYTSNGVIKKLFHPRSKWNAVSRSADPNFATYVKSMKGIPPDEYDGRYEKYVGWTVPHFALDQKYGRPIDLQEDCDKRGQCAGFDTDGWLKSGIPTQYYWAFDNDLDVTLYVKGRYRQRMAKQYADKVHRLKHRKHRKAKWNKE